MSEVVYKNLGELVKEARKKYGFSNKGRSIRYPVDHKKGTRFTTGFSKVFKIKSPNYAQGFNYRYVYYDNNGKRKILSSVDIKKLHDNVISKGLDWEIVDKSKALKVANFHNIDLDELR